MGDTEIPNDAELDAMIQSLTDWLAKQPHLPRIQDDKKLLRKFLVNCKYRVQKAKFKIDQYYSSRTAYPTVYRNRDPCADSIETVAKLCPLFVLPKRTNKGELAIVARAEPNVSDIIPMDYLRYLTMCLDMTFMEEDNLDFIVIIDFRGFSFQHFLKLTTIAATTTELLMEVFPGKFKGEYCVHVPGFIDSVVSMFKRMVKSKFKDRIHVYTQLKDFHHDVGRDFLPNDLGGNELSIQELGESYLKRVQSYNDWFKSQEDVRSKEELRPAATKNSTIMGIEGSFRSLTVD